MTKGLTIRFSGEHLLVGVDCGTLTGLCFVDPANQASLDKYVVATHTTDFWGAYDIFETFSKQGAKDLFRLYIEQPNQIKVLYSHHQQNLADRNSRVQTRDKIVWDAGGNAREAMLLSKRLMALGYNVVNTKPIKAKKWDAGQFTRYMGWEGQSNQHVRDAGRLVYGMRW